jgi:hypothetical protein
MSQPSLSCSPEPCSSRARPERRAVIRYLCGREAACSILPAYERLTGHLREVSTKGASLVLPSQVEPGTHLVLEIKTQAPGITLALLARVIHATQRSDTGWIVGCEFLTRPTEEQVSALL